MRGCRPLPCCAVCLEHCCVFFSPPNCARAGSRPPGIATPHNNTPSMLTTQGSNSSGASAVDHAGSEQQAGPSMDADPTNEPIDSDEDHNQTQAGCATLAIFIYSHIEEGILSHVPTLNFHLDSKRYNLRVSFITSRPRVVKTEERASTLEPPPAFYFFQPKDPVFYETKCCRIFPHFAS